ncbi:hypothetical protein BC829DRAFT_440579 [Chytridium lagenaria]|nr:hypothetical protein BC829DRAFT_440579 [Chytridium lagenaria]
MPTIITAYKDPLSQQQQREIVRDLMEEDAIYSNPDLFTTTTPTIITAYEDPLSQQQQREIIRDLMEEDAESTYPNIFDLQQSMQRAEQYLGEDEIEEGDTIMRSVTPTYQNPVRHQHDQAPTAKEVNIDLTIPSISPSIDNHVHHVQPLDPSSLFENAAYHDDDKSLDGTDSDIECQKLMASRLSVPISVDTNFIDSAQQAAAAADRETPSLQNPTQPQLPIDSIIPSSILQPLRPCTVQPSSQMIPKSSTLGQPTKTRRGFSFNAFLNPNTGRARHAQSVEDVMRVFRSIVTKELAESKIDMYYL